MDASEGTVSICFCLLPARHPDSSSVFFGLLFSPSSLEDFLSSLFRVICEPLPLTRVCLCETACACVRDWMHACTVVYKLDCSRWSDNFSRVDSIGYMCSSSIWFYYSVMPFSKLILEEPLLWLLVALFSLAFYYFYWRSTLKGGGRQSALCMPCVHPLYAYSWYLGRGSRSNQVQ